MEVDAWNPVVPGNSAVKPCGPMVPDPTLSTATPLEFNCAIPRFEFRLQCAAVALQKITCPAVTGALVAVVTEAVNLTGVSYSTPVPALVVNVMVVAAPVATDTVKLWLTGVAAA
jgi:hypothetical protein